MPLIGRVLFLVWLIMPMTSQGACQGKLASITSQTAILYNPFAAVDFHSSIVLTLQNTGTERCAYALTIPAKYYPLRFGPGLAFNLRPAGEGGSGTVGPFSISTTTVQPGQSVSITAILSLTRGQLVSSGTLANTLGFTLAAAGTNGPALDQIQIVIRCTVPPVFEINIAGSGQHVTVDFGELTPNDTRTIVLQSRSTEDHLLEFQSEHKGALVRKGGLKGDASRVPYTLAINGQHVDLTRPSVINFATRAAEFSSRMSITIGDTANRLAGIYRDIITISIRSVL